MKRIDGSPGRGTVAELAYAMHSFQPLHLLDPLTLNYIVPSFIGAFCQHAPSIDPRLAGTIIVSLVAVLSWGIFWCLGWISLCISNILLAGLGRTARASRRRCSEPRRAREGIMACPSPSGLNSVKLSCKVSCVALTVFLCFA